MCHFLANKNAVCHSHPTALVFGHIIGVLDKAIIFNVFFPCTLIKCNSFTIQNLYSIRIQRTVYSAGSQHCSGSPTYCLAMINTFNRKGNAQSTILFFIPNILSKSADRPFCVHPTDCKETKDVHGVGVDASIHRIIVMFLFHARDELLQLGVHFLE